MKHIKRVITIFFIFIIMAASLVPSFSCSHFVYADDATDEWTNVTTNAELVEAFRYYCKSRNLVVDGSALDVLTNFTSSSFNKICNFIGVDVTALQAHLKRSTDSNNRVQFLFDEFGITAYNRIFAEFLQNYDLEVGDSVENQIIEQGEFVLDAEGHGAFVYVVSGLNSNTGATCSAYGSTYKYTSSDLVNICLQHGEGTDIRAYFTDQGGERYLSLRYSTYPPETFITYNKSRYDQSGGLIKYINTDRNINQNLSHMAILKYGNSYYCGVACDFLLNRSNGTTSSGYTWFANTSSYFYPYQNKGNQTIIINSTEINSNTYTDNRQTVINNEGDVYNYDYDDDDPPINPPSGGGGDDPPTDPDDWGIDLPDLNIDWLLTGKENKFPFNIPFNIILTLSLLNAEPEAPHFEGTIDLGVYQWNYEIDLEQFDPVAEVCRNFEFIAFLIGLMLLTKRLIWG